MIILYELVLVLALINGIDAPNNGCNNHSVGGILEVVLEVGHCSFSAVIHETHFPQPRVSVGVPPSSVDGFTIVVDVESKFVNVHAASGISKLSYGNKVVRCSLHPECSSCF